MFDHRFGDRLLSSVKVVVDSRSITEPQVDTRLPGPRQLVGPLLLLAAVAGLWSMLARQPLWHTDLWGHLAYGRWMTEHDGQAPLREPFLPYADDSPLVNTARLSQLIGYRVLAAGGVEALQLLYATLVSGCALLAVCPVLVSRCRHRIPAAIAGAAIFLAVGWQQIEIIRPQLAGLACFTLLLALLHDPRPAWWRVVLVSVVLAAWANLHGSFVIGWLLLTAHLLGRAIDRVARTRSLNSWCSDRQFTFRLWQTIVGLLAPLLATPYGFHLPWVAWRIGRHPNLADIIEWQPLAWDQPQAKAMLVATVLIVSLGLASRQTVRAWAAVMLVTTGIAALVCSRMINWWAPVAGLVVALQASTLGKPTPFAAKLTSARWQDPARRGLAVALIAFATVIAAPAARGMLTERDNLLARRPIVSAATPIEVTDWLRKHPPRGIVLAAYEWGDFLIWQGPPRIQLLVASHAHLVPESAWQDYIQVIRVADDWNTRLDRHNIQTLVLDRHRQAGLIEALEALGAKSNWKQVYADQLAEVWTR